MSSLKEKAIKGIFWNATDLISQQSIRIITLIILSRLLMPRDFGIFGMLAIFMAVAQSLIDSGFGQALIQKKNASQVDFSSVFYLNLFVGLIMFLLIYFFAPIIAQFFNEPQLINISRVMGIIFIFHSLSLIHLSLLARNIDFKTLTKVGLLSVILAGIIGIVLAFKGFGIWSLVLQNVCMVFFRSILLWFFNKWRPSLLFNLKSIKSLFSFGSKLLVSGLLDQFFRNLYYLIIGKAFDATSLGYYNQAYRLQQYPSQNLTSIIQKVTFPVFSKFQDDNKRLKRGYRKVLTSIVYINFPVMIGLMSIASPLFKFLLTEKWIPAVPYFQLLCIVGLFYPIHALNLNILKVKGRSDLFLKLEVLKKILIVVAIAVCLPFGIMALIVGQVIVNFISLFINSYYSGKLLGYGAKIQFMDLYPYFLISLIMGSIVWFLGEIISLSDFKILIIQISIGLIFYLAISSIMRIEAFQDSIDIFKIIIFKRSYVNTGE